MGLTYTKPKIEESKSKPQAIANKGFPYQSLADSRRFEELLYTIGVERIQRGDWKNLYDDIQLLQGVRERGRDCIMFLEGKSLGLIQCKHSSTANRITLPTLALEVTKFVLHYLVDPKLIYNRDEFTYFFAIDFGFSEPALDLLSSFNDRIIEHPDLETWTRKVISANISLNHLEYDKICNDLKDTLSRINVKPILPQDLDKLLLEEGKESIIKAFFEVRSIIDSKVSRQILDDLIEIKTSLGYQTISKLPLQVIQEKFEFASYHLFNYNNSFEGIENSHFERTETGQIIRWIKEFIPLEHEPIAILSGNAGSGKTVVLQDIYNSIRADKIPVIGLKVDRYASVSIKELEDKLNLEDSFEKMVNSLAEDNDRVVVIIDQIDALSQSLSSRRDYLDTVTQLVRKLGCIQKIRIIISARIYDLNYDSELKFYRNQKVFNLSLLNVGQVDQILTHLKINKASLSKALYELLRTPHHLSVLCKVHNQEVNLSTLKSRHDLHEQLWISRILKVPKTSSATKEKCQELAYLMARQMHENQEIFISDAGLKYEYIDEIDYLKSVEIITQVDGKIQFFHQTFYDFAYARQFIYSNQSIIAYLKRNHQGLFIRSSLKMILQFLRDYNHPEYVKTVSTILFGRAYRFHLKLMVINLVGFETAPTNSEIELIQSKVLKSSSMKRLFIESAFGEVWLQTLIDSGLLTELLSTKGFWYDNLFKKDFKSLNVFKEKLSRWINYKSPEARQEENLQLCLQTLIRQLPESGKLVCNFLRQSPDFNGKADFIFRLLYYLEDWDNEDAIWLFKENEAEANKDRFGYFKILENAAKYRMDWVLEMYKKLCFQKIDKPKEPGSTRDIFEHVDQELFKKIFETNPKKAFDFTLEVTQKLIDSNSWIDKTKLYGDLIYMWYSYEKGQSYSNEFLLNLLIDQLRVFAQEKSPKFMEFYKEYRNHNSMSMLIVLIHGLQVNTTHYKNESFEFIKIFHSKGGFSEATERTAYQVRQLINKTYSVLNSKQKDRIDRIILEHRNEPDLKVYEEKGVKKHYLQYNGRAQLIYLKAIPDNEVDKRPALKKRRQELERKFDNVLDKKPQGSIVRSISPPLTKNAYTNMKHENWEETFQKYTKEYQPDFGSFRGSIFEHSRAFQEEVKNRPNFFFPLIEKIISDPQVPRDYASTGLNGLVESKFDHIEVQRIYKKYIKTALDIAHTLYATWLIDYFLEHKSLDVEVLDFLIDCALNYPDPSDNTIRHEPLNDGINTVRGAAASRLSRTFFNKNYENKIFTCLNQVADDPSLAVRVTLLPRLALLMHLNEEKTLNLFLKLVSKNEPEIIKHSFWTSQYLLKNNFDRLIPYFQKAIKIEDSHDSLANTLMQAWFKEKPNAESLLDELVKFSDKAISTIIHSAAENMADAPELKEKCRAKLMSFLHSDSDEVIDAYSHAFLHLPLNMFEELLPFLRMYARSVAAKKSPHYFYEYLLKSAKTHPVECIQLLTNFRKYDKPNISSGRYYDNDPIKVLIGAYNALSVQENSSELRKAIELFDKMLKDSRFRQEANRVLSEVEA